MSVTVENDMIRLRGDCPIDDAEVLLRALIAAPAAAIDWRDCRTAHTAVVQVMMAGGRHLVGPPAGKALERWINPSVARPTGP